MDKSTQALPVKLKRPFWSKSSDIALAFLITFCCLALTPLALVNKTPSGGEHEAARSFMVAAAFGSIALSIFGARRKKGRRRRALCSLNMVLAVAVMALPFSMDDSTYMIFIASLALLFVVVPMALASRMYVAAAAVSVGVCLFIGPGFLPPEKGPFERVAQGVAVRLGSAQRSGDTTLLRFKVSNPKGGYDVANTRVEFKSLPILSFSMSSGMRMMQLLPNGVPELAPLEIPSWISRFDATFTVPKWPEETNGEANVPLPKSGERKLKEKFGQLTIEGISMKQGPIRTALLLLLLDRPFGKSNRLRVFDDLGNEYQLQPLGGDDGDGRSHFQVSGLPLNAKSLRLVHYNVKRPPGDEAVFELKGVPTTFGR